MSEFSGEARPYYGSPMSPTRDLGPLLSLNYQRLQTAQSPSDPEVLKLFDAVRGLGFFYLDFRDNIRETAYSNVGESGILEEATSLFGLMKKFFDLPVSEKQKYSVINNGGYFG
jgi:isopenicillin N synthase-like dioxygenase